MSLFDEHREKVREKIYEASIAAFQSKGYENASILEITKSVGVAKGTFYNFYLSKQEVLFVWAQNMFSGLNIGKAMKTEKTLEQNLEAFVDLTVEAIDASQGLFRTFLSELLKSQGEVNRSGQFDFIKIYEDIVNHSSDNNTVISQDFDTKVEMINSVLFMGIINWCNKHVQTKGLSDHLKKSMRLLLNGIL